MRSIAQVARAIDVRGVLPTRTTSIGHCI